MQSIVFNDFKSCIACALIVHHPDPKRPFFLEVDAYSIEVFAVLFQQSDGSKHLPCGFSLLNYTSGDCKLLAVKLSLE